MSFDLWFFNGEFCFFPSFSSFSPHNGNVHQDNVLVLGAAFSNTGSRGSRC